MHNLFDRVIQLRPREANVVITAGVTLFNSTINPIKAYTQHLYILKAMQAPKYTHEPNKCVYICLLMYSHRNPLGEGIVTLLAALNPFLLKEICLNKTP